MWTKLACALALLSASVGCDRSGESGSLGGGDSATGKAPSFEYAGTGGCARFLLYRTNQDVSEVFVVSGDLDSLGIPEQGRVLEFDLANAPVVLGQKTISVTVEMYPRPQKHLHHCQDFTDPDSDKPAIWTATSGRMQIQHFAPEKKAEAGPPLFRLKVTVTDAEFQDSSGRKATCPHPVVLDTTVGWFAG
jgi:hypothetical protein